MSTRSLLFVPASLVALVLVLGGGSATLLSGVTDAAIAQCGDGFDNDSDGRIDYPSDPDCADSSDNDEHTVAGSVFVSITDGKDRTAPGNSGIYAVTLSSNDNFTQTVTVIAAFPSEFGILSATNAGAINGSSVRWTNVSVSRNSPVTFTVQGTVSPRATDGNTLVARVTAGNREATDTTLIRSTVLNANEPAFDISISDGETSVLPSEDLDYVVRVKNTEGVSMTADVRVSLSPFLAFVDPEGETDHTSSRILWAGQNFGPDEERTYRFSGRAVERARRNEVIRISASAGGAVDTDSTTIRSSITPHNLDIGISDGLAAASWGDVITYQVRIDNPEDGTVTDAYVSAALPIYGEFVAANDGGIRDGSNVRWTSLEIPANGSRTVAFSVRIRSDAPLGTELVASAAVDGITDFDRTTVVEKRAVQTPVSSVRSRRSTRTSGGTVVQPVSVSSATPRSSTKAVYRPATTAYAAAVTAKPSQSVLLQKTSDRKVVLAGGTVRYRVIVNNVTGSPLSGLTLTDRFNGDQLDVADAGGAAKVLDGSLEWNVPTLQPGDSWSASYALKAGASLASGTVLQNLAAINGAGLDAVALDKRISGTKVSVVTSLPSTGAPMDLLALLALGILPVMPAAMQRKMKR